MPSITPTTVQLTDQALVAIHLARSMADTRRVNVAHLMVGILGEPDGLAGRRVRQRAGGEPGVRLAAHAGVHAPGLPTLSAALIALPVTSTPAWTEDLLRAGLRTGGQELQDLLRATNLDVAVVAETGSDEQRTDEGETFGRGTFSARGFTAVADEAVARARAAGTTIGSLVPMLALENEERQAMSRLPDVSIQRVIDRVLAMRRESITMQDLATAVLSVALEELRLPGRDH